MNSILKNQTVTLKQAILDDDRNITGWTETELPGCHIDRKKSLQNTAYGPENVSVVVVNCSFVLSDVRPVQKLIDRVVLPSGDEYTIHAVSDFRLIPHTEIEAV